MLNGATKAAPGGLQGTLGGGDTPPDAADDEITFEDAARELFRAIKSGDESAAQDALRACIALERD
jgi:hypothetical protein